MVIEERPLQGRQDAGIVIDEKSRAKVSESAIMM